MIKINFLRQYVMAFLLLTLIPVTLARGYRYHVDPKDQPITTLSLDKVDIRDALTALCKTLNVEFRLAPNVQGEVTIIAENEAFETILKSMLSQIGASFRIESGVYHIVMREQPKALPPLVDASTSIVKNAEEDFVVIPIRYCDPKILLSLITQEVNTNISLPPESSVLDMSGLEANSSIGSGFGNRSFGTNNFRPRGIGTTFNRGFGVN